MFDVEVFALLDSKAINRSYVFSFNCLYGPRHAKMCFLEYADSNGPDQHVHARSVTGAFTVR